METLISEIDILEWIGQLENSATCGAKEDVKRRLKAAGAEALPWLMRSYNGNRELNEALTELVREITSREGIPRKGGRAIRRALSPE